MSNELAKSNSELQFSRKIRDGGTSSRASKEPSVSNFLDYDKISSAGIYLEGNKLMVKTKKIGGKLTVLNPSNGKRVEVRTNPRSVLKSFVNPEVASPGTSLLKRRQLFTIKHKPAIIKRVRFPNNCKSLVPSKAPFSEYTGKFCDVKSSLSRQDVKQHVNSEHNYFCALLNSPPRRKTTDVATELHNVDQTATDMLKRNRSMSLSTDEAELLTFSCVTVDINTESLDEIKQELHSEIDEELNRPSKTIYRKLINASTQTEIETKTISVGTEELFEKLVQAKAEELTKGFDIVDYIVDDDNMLELVKSTLDSNCNPSLNQSQNSQQVVSKQLNSSRQNNVCETQRKAESWKAHFFNDLKTCDTFDASGNMRLHVAVILNDLSAVKRQSLALHTRKIGVDYANKEGLTALQLALVYNSDLPIVQVLLQFQANTNVLDSEGNTVLHNAVMYSSDAVVELLVLSSEPSSLDALNFEGYTPLMLCVTNKKYKMADIILSAGAHPNLGDQKSGRTALFHAVENNDVDMVKLLLHHKAETKAKNFFGTSPHDAMYELESIDSRIKKLILNKDCLTNSKPKSTGRGKRKKETDIQNIKVIKFVKKK